MPHGGALGAVAGANEADAAGRTESVKPPAIEHRCFAPQMNLEPKIGPHKQDQLWFWELHVCTSVSPDLEEAGNILVLVCSVVVFAHDKQGSLMWYPRKVTMHRQNHSQSHALGDQGFCVTCESDFEWYSYHLQLNHQWRVQTVSSSITLCSLAFPGRGPQ